MQLARIVELSLCAQHVVQVQQTWNLQFGHPHVECDLRVQGKVGLQNEYQDALCYAKCPLNLNDLFIP